MKKIPLVGLALVAIGAFLALATTSAFALEYTLAEWLNDGLSIIGAMNTDGTSQILLENTSNKADILCSGLAVGTVGPEDEDTVTAFFSLSGAKIEELDGPSATGGVSCTGDNLCETGSEIWPVNLPFLTLLVLDTTEEKWYDLVLENSGDLLPSYNVNCKTIIGTVNELCEAALESGGEVVNKAAGVEPKGPVEELGTCTGVVKVGLAEALPGGLITLNAGGTLTVSE